ncbi:MAG TPA: hypothetical protein VGO71_18105 [Baekduia sp.]|nr:hypothetical protein [Baekduia sp.]
MQRHPLVLLVVVAAAALAACGSSSSKPSYCSDKSSLDSSMKGITTVDVRSNGISALTAQAQKVQDDAKALVSSAKGDFPQQTSAITTSVDALNASLKGLPSSPSLQQLAGVATNATSVASAVKGFSDATSSKC